MEVHEELQDLRRRVLSGEDVPAEDYKKLLDDIRGGRKSAAETKGRTSRSTVKEIDPDDLFG